MIYKSLGRYGLRIAEVTAQRSVLGSNSPGIGPLKINDALILLLLPASRYGNT